MFKRKVWWSTVYRAAEIYPTQSIPEPNHDRLKRRKYEGGPCTNSDGGTPANPSCEVSIDVSMVREFLATLNAHPTGYSLHRSSRLRRVNNQTLTRSVTGLSVPLLTSNSTRYVTFGISSFWRIYTSDLSGFEQHGL